MGRDEEENEKIGNLAQKEDISIEMKEYPGPVTLIRNYGSKEISDSLIKAAKQLTQYYSTKARNKKNIDFKVNKI